MGGVPPLYLKSHPRRKASGRYRKGVKFAKSKSDRQRKKGLVQHRNLLRFASLGSKRSSPSCPVSLKAIRQALMCASDLAYLIGPFRCHDHDN